MYVFLDSILLILLSLELKKIPYYIKGLWLGFIYIYIYISWTFGFPRFLWVMLLWTLKAIFSDAYVYMFARVYTWEFCHVFWLFVKTNHHSKWQNSISLFCNLCLEWEVLLLHGISCGAGMIIVNRLQSAGARMAAMWTAQSHLDSWLGAQPGSFFFFFFGSFTWAARTASQHGGWVLRKSLPRERKLPG